MFTIQKKYEIQFRERGSKFMGLLFPAESESIFGEELDRVKSAYPDATHHCYAWRIDPAQPKEFSSDDGEPSGTAGLPILNQLRSFEVVNAGLVVVRYYGGTKLGKPGLIEAYGGAAEQCLDAARLISIRPVRHFSIEYQYPEENVIRKLQNQYELKILDAEYLASVQLKVACPLTFEDDLEKELHALEHLGIQYQKMEQHYL